MQVAHFLEADVQPWAAALSAALFGADPWHVQSPPYAWERLEEIATLGDTVEAVLRRWRMPLLEQLPRTPAEWQPAVIGSHAVDGALTLDLAQAAACRGAMRDLHAVHSLVLHGCEHSSDDESESDSGSEHDADAVSVEELVPALHAVATMPVLRSLKLDFECVWVDEPAGDLASALTRLSQLTSLNLSFNELNATGAGVLASALTCLSRLALLNLSENYVGADGAAALAQPLATLTALTTLHLGSNELGAAGAEALAPALCRLSRLAHLDLEHNDIGAAGAATLAQPICSLTALTVLNLYNNGMHSAGAEALVPALRRLPRLAHLGLAANSIGDGAAAALAQPLAELTALTALFLNLNKVGAAGAEALAPALRRLTRLQLLNLKANFFLSDAGLAHLVPALACLPALRRVFLLRCNGLSNAAEAGARKRLGGRLIE